MIDHYLHRRGICHSRTRTDYLDGDFPGRASRAHSSNHDSDRHGGGQFSRQMARKRRVIETTRRVTGP